jgi:Fe2+ transport system protein FeoA
MNLADIKEGNKAIVIRIKGNSAIKQRLMDMGITRGAKIKVERYAPLYDPIAIKIKGYSLALRVEEGKMIEVELEE